MQKPQNKMLEKILTKIVLVGALALSSCADVSDSSGSSRKNNASESRGVVTGRITFPYVEGNSLVRRGIENARATAIGTDTRTYTDSNGEFVLKEIPAGFQEIEGSCQIYDGCEPYEDTDYASEIGANPSSDFIDVVRGESRDIGDLELTPFMIRDRIIHGMVYSSQFNSSTYNGPLNLFLPNDFCSGNIPHDCSPTYLLESKSTTNGIFAFRQQTDRKIL